MNSTNVTEICNPCKTWTLAEANSILPVLKRIGNQCDDTVNKILANQRCLIISGASKELIEKLDKSVQEALIRWGNKIVRLGVKRVQGQLIFPKSDGGAYSWYANEETVCHYIDYSDPVGVRRFIPTLGQIG